MSEHNESRRRFFQKTITSSAGLLVAPVLLSGKTKTDVNLPLKDVKAEWRNRQSGMSYRMLGRTGLMVSELVMGTFPYNDAKYFPIIDAGIERGLNYIDTAPAYSQGAVESTLGEYLGRNGNREKVFLSTKLSSYYGYIDSLVNDILKGLPQGKKEAIENKAQALIEKRSALKPGYHINYFNGQERQVNRAYVRHFVLQEYGLKKEWRLKIKERAYDLLHASLKRLKTDYLDVLHCPHGVSMPETLDDDVLRELFAEFKEKGLIRNSAVSFHNDVTANLSKVIEVGYYDAAMFAYNIANHAGLETLIYKANQAGVGLIGMKLARKFAMEDAPQWMEDKLNQVISGENLSKFAKAYFWGLQNQNLSCCVSQMETLDELKENFSIIGRKIDMRKV